MVPHKVFARPQDPGALIQQVPSYAQYNRNRPYNPTDDIFQTIAGLMQELTNLAAQQALQTAQLAGAGGFGPDQLGLRLGPPRHPNGSPVDFGNSVVYSLSNGVSQAIATITSGIPGQVHSSGIPAGNPGFEHQSVDGLPIDPLRIQPSRPRPRPRPSSPESGNFAFTSQSSGSNGRPVVTVEEFASEPDIGLRLGPTRGSGRPSSASAGVVSSGTDFASASGGVSVSSSK